MLHLKILLQCNKTRSTSIATIKNIYASLLEETEFKEIDGHSNLSSGSSGGKLVFLPGIRFQMRTGTASGKCFMRGYRRTMVGVGTGFYCVADP